MRKYNVFALFASYALRVAVVPCIALTACTSDFEAPSAIRGLRVLALRSEPASGTPGETVKIQLLAADGGVAPGDAPRHVELVWIGGCHNPPTRQFYACYPFLGAVASALDSTAIATPPSRFPPGIFKASSFTLPAKDEAAFDFVLPADVLSAAPHASRDAIHFGVSYTFFALCAGELRPNPELTDRIPFDCFVPGTQEKLGYRDFVTGFATLYTYEGLQNTNPVISSLTFNGVDTASFAVPCETDADCAHLVAPESQGFGAVCSSRLCAPRVSACKHDGCPEYLVTPHLASGTAEPLPEGGTEVTWANFYATQGSFEADTELLNDRSAGWLGERGTNFKAPAAAADFVDLWVTVNDQRGGAAWQSVRIVVGD